MRQFSLREAVPLAQTPRARLWTARADSGAPVVLKLYVRGDMGNEASGAQYLERLAGRAAVRILARSGVALVMEHLAGPSLGDHARAGAMQEADEKLGQVAVQLCAAGIPIAEMLPVERLFAPLLQARDLGGEMRRAQDLGRTLLRAIEQDPSAQVALHGDLHHDNVILTRAGPRAFDAKGLAGPPAYELANAFRHPRGLASRACDPEVIRWRARIWSRACGSSASDLLRWAVAKVALSILWAEQDSAADQRLLKHLLQVADQGLRD